MDIDFIKWMCEKAEGFELFDGDIVDPRKLFHRPSMFVKDLVLYPLLLQRSIERVNRESDEWRISMLNGCIYVHKVEGDPLERYSLSKHEIDTAKESALRYVYEQEAEK